MQKFQRLYEVLREEGIATEENTWTPEAADPEMVARVHHVEYVDNFVRGVLDPRAQRRIGLPWSPGLVRRTFRAVGGTVLTARLAVEHGLAVNTAGGTHHAHAAFGSGFCILNDLAVAARSVIREGLARSVLVFDLDVHQGDGTAAACADDPSVFTASVHCGDNFPFRKQRSDLDVALPAGTGDRAYLEAVSTALDEALERGRPDLVLYDAGVDVYAGDRLGRLNLSLAGIVERDTLVLKRLRATGIPTAAVIGGGYDADIDALADRHAILHRVASNL